MNILVTGAKGMVGTALCNNLKNIRDGKNKTRPALDIKEIYEYDLDSTSEELDEYCRRADFVFNLAGVNRPENPEDFMKGNFGFASDLLNCLKKHNNKATIMLSSSIQATLAGRFGNSEYGRSKKAGEELFFQYAEETGAKVAVYRFVNLMGHSRPKYNSAVSTFCWAVANDEPFTVNDRSTELELLYIDDLVEGMFDLLEGKEQHCKFDGVETVLQADGRYCCVPVTHKVTLGETVVLLSKGEIDSKKVRVEFSLEDMDMSGFQKGATYEQIKAYVLEHTGLKVSSLYISQIKRKCGLDVGQNYNLSKKEDAKVPKCPPEKEAAIRDALKYFQMI